jgi:hypothetical protein
VSAHARHAAIARWETFSVFGVNHANYAGALNNLAMVYWKQGKYEEAEGLCKRALAIDAVAKPEGQQDRNLQGAPRS